MSFTIGSLFDGSGGFPLAAFMCGGSPTWASEIEPYPIAVTKTRFPYMKHLGSVTEIKGNEVDPVDVITFGSPCQDLSVAGKRAGLKHTDNGDEETTRSGLFMEAVRIIKEMREATGGKFPSIACWENVPGAFSSNKGEDFRVVCEELIKIVEPSAVMPSVPKGGWNYADCFRGDGWSLAYRVLDSQFWGVPQRRRRIYLVLDLGGERAGEILFEREGLRGYFTEGRTPWETAAGNAENGVGTADCERKCVIAIDQQGGKGGANYAENVMPTLCSDSHGTPHAVAYGISPYHSNSMKSSNPNSGIYVADTARTLDAMNCGYPGCNQGGMAIVEPLCMATQQGGAEIMADKCPTITAAAGMSGNNQPVVAYGFDQGATRDVGDLWLEEQSKTLTNGTCPGHHNGVVIAVPTAVYSVENHPADSRVNIDDSGKVQTLTSRMGTGGGNVPMVMEPVVYESHPMDSRIKELENVAPTVSVKWHKGSADTPLVCEKTVCLEGNGSRPSHRGDGYRESDVMYTLNATEQHSVAYSLETFHCVAEEEMAAPLKARDYKDPLCVCIDRAYFNQGQNALYTPQTYEDGTTPTLVAMGPAAVAYGVDCRNATEYEESNGALQAACNHNHNSNNVVRIQYIVRRLTPTECARLQGFPDRWATPDKKDSFTNEEYEFWCKVNLDYDRAFEKARPNNDGWYNVWREVKPNKVKGEDFEPYWEDTGNPYTHKTMDQMLKWYNKLHTDSAEYKLWGNGIALPCALYVMQGIADVFNRKADKND